MSHGQGWLGMVHPEDRAHTQTAWHAAAARGGGVEVEQRLSRADGAWRWFQIRVVPLCDAGGRTTHWFGTSRDVDDLRRAEQHALYLSRHDALTGAAYWAGLLHGSENAPDTPCCLLCLALDVFKAANDPLGHPGGDALLREVAARLRMCLGPNDLLACVDGDEFVLVLFHGEEAVRIASR